ncbi:DEBR0S6_00122g1_1 [Brettanomyces bruxellensis]|uniref:DEBR0S6_00122g1_1 n=1 Tax=Dekkera bruxellensis TaxID=5007 RepID=A0A7D9H1X2_DEKBR|nr:DEBR0S6_00122g1_1 [Brettanomyces bruxellensis]
MAHIATDNLTANNLGQLSKISSPEIYSEKFIKECKELGELAQYVYFDEVPVGFVVSNVFQPQNSSVPIGLIISVLKVLPAYAHKYGLENALISYVEKMTTEKRLLHRIFLLADRKNDQWLIAYARKQALVKILNACSY